MIDVKNEMVKNAELVNKALDRLLINKDDSLKELYEAMRYSAFSGGKRVRPYIVMSVCRCFGGDENAALCFACALELIHTYSLIHDDLPCMDNDDYRRGIPTCHKRFGEATALLAGDALLTLAFETVSDASGISPDMKVKAITALSKAAGPAGMIGGQMLDLKGVKEYEAMARMHSLKTGALIKTACILGCISAGVDDEKIIRDVEEYGEGIGRVFQLVDDLLDSDENGSDEKNGRITYTAFMSRDMALQIAQLITEKAIGSIAGYDKDGRLSDIAEFLRTRKK